MKDIDMVLEEKDNARVLLTAFQTMLDNTTDMVFIKDADLTYLAATMPFVKMVGKQTVEDVIGRTDMEIFEDHDLAKRYVHDDRKMFAAGEDLLGFVEPLPEENGLARYGITSKYILTDRRGEIIGLMGVTRDVTKEILARQRHQQELEYLFELPEDTYGAIFIDIHDWRIVGERRQPVDELSIPLYDTMEVFRDSTLRYVPTGCAAHEFYQAFSRASLQAIYDSGKRSLTLEYPRIMVDGTLRWVKTDITFLADPTSGHLCAMVLVRDINSQKQAEQQILQAAETDEMTGLLNRSATMKQIDQFLREEGSAGSHALLIIDVDNFKEVNDTFGHQAGDRFLTRLAQTIRSCFRSTDIVGRIGGDEFFVLMKDSASRTAVEEKIAALLREMQTVCDAHTKGVMSVSGSVGVCRYNGGDSTLEQLYEQADQALYQAKRQGKNRVVFAGTTKT